MKRTVKKQFWFSRAEAQDLQKKAKKACLTEAALAATVKATGLRSVDNGWTTVPSLRRV